MLMRWLMSIDAVFLQYVDFSSRHPCILMLCAVLRYGVLSAQLLHPLFGAHTTQPDVMYLLGVRPSVMVHQYP